MFKFEFMRTAFLVGSMIAVVLPLIGNTVVFKRMSMVGDALSHISLSGIAVGLIFGFNPLIGAIAMSIISALSVQAIQKRLGAYTEISISIVMSLGIGLSAILLNFVDQPNAFNTYLFGSIVAIGGSDALLAIMLTVIIILISILNYRQFFFTAFDETSAQLAGINVNFSNTLFMILTAVTVSVASRILGALIVSSLLVIPTAISMQLAKSYRSTMYFGMASSLVSVWLGLTVSYYMNLAPGGTIVISSILLLLIAILYRLISGKSSKL